MEDSLAIVRAAAIAGTRAIVATSHVSWEYQNQADELESLVAELRERIAAESLDIEIHMGAEIAMTRVVDTATPELSRLTLGGGLWLLLEPPFSPTAPGLELVVDDLHSRGACVLLAHPERCAAFHRDPALLKRLIASGALASVTAGSLNGRFGTAPQQFAFELIREGLAHNVASDAHDPFQRPPTIAPEIESAGLEPLAQWLTEDVPAAILGGYTEVPPRPEVEIGFAKQRWRPRW
jgi:protein-tyrosine phosphatase